MGSAAATVTTVSAELVAANPQRISLIITNNGTSNLFLGQTSSVDTAGTNAGIKLIANGTYAEDGGTKGMYNGPVFAIAGSASTTAAVWERER
jgi:hypothetical protein